MENNWRIMQKFVAEFNGVCYNAKCGKPEGKGCLLSILGGANPPDSIPFGYVKTEGGSRLHAKMYFCFVRLPQPHRSVLHSLSHCICYNIFEGKAQEK